MRDESGGTNRGGDDGDSFSGTDGSTAETRDEPAEERVEVDESDAVDYGESDAVDHSDGVDESDSVDHGDEVDEEEHEPSVAGVFGARPEDAPPRPDIVPESPDSENVLFVLLGVLLGIFVIYRAVVVFGG